MEEIEGLVDKASQPLLKKIERYERAIARQKENEKRIPDPHGMDAVPGHALLETSSLILS
jgi:hypothetical protein